MSPIFFALYQILNVVWFFIVAHFIMSWLIAFNVLNMHQQMVGQIWQGLSKILEPIYGPIRRYMPDLGGVDLAPLVALLGVVCLQYALRYYG
ncbi:MAG: YggT family protein [Planktomarina sp.]